jgi:cytochrome b pre-mRNA-processing protein 3
MTFAWMNRIFGGGESRDAWRPLYAAIVAKARETHWYVEGGVPDSIDGRFECLSLVASLVLLRMEMIGDNAAPGMALLTEVLVADMEGQVREIGFGDLVVGKQVGQMMGALGGRLGAYRDGLAGGDLAAALTRNLFRGDPPLDQALAHVEAQVRALAATLADCAVDDLKAGGLSK